MLESKDKPWLVRKKPVMLSSNDVGNDNRSAFTLAFEVENRELAAQLVLCWVDRNGALRHFYDIGSRHVEHTYTGDAFVLFESQPGSQNPKLAEELRHSLCSFQASQAPPVGHEYIVRIRLFTPESGGVDCEFHVEVVRSLEKEYRVIVRFPRSDYCLPSYSKDWVLDYCFSCPPLPLQGDFDKRQETFYVWGDLSFDRYGPTSTHRAARGKSLHPYKMNQIVPQVMCGRCLAANDDQYKPRWLEFDSWVIQAQYYWQTAEDEGSNSRAHCGEVVHVKPGEILKSTFKYVAESGRMHVSIEAVGRDRARSEITIDRPFPNDHTMFESWASFFRRCEEVEESVMGCMGRPTLNIEYKGRCRVKTLKSVCPFIIHRASYPGYEDVSISRWRTELFCPSQGSVVRLMGNDGTDLRVGESVTLGSSRPSTQLHDCTRWMKCWS